ncbi:MAG TPA: hypothetical protein VLR47_10400 [Rhodospirillales bacterium]|nr:hypothetical protein [Rhodospirillales bacterium]
MALAAGDLVAAGDVLITRLGDNVLIDLHGGASLAMSGAGRAEIRPGEGGEVHLVVHAGAFVATPGPRAGVITIETGAAIVAVEGGPLAFRYDLETGLRASAGPEEAARHVRIVNDSGVHVLDEGAPAFAVAQWSEPPASMSAADFGTGWLPPLALARDGAAPAGASAEGEAGGQLGEDAPLEGDAGEAEMDGGPDFETGAGTAEEGDPTFVYAAPAAGSVRGLADLAPAAAPLPVLAPEPALSSAPTRAGASAPAASSPGHDIDALFLWQPPAEASLPPALPALPTLPTPPHLRGWEPSERTWEIAGTAELCGGERERSADGSLTLIRPTEGKSMAALTAEGLLRNDLERFLGLQFDELNDVLHGATAHGGSAIKTSIKLEAGQTLVFDVLFDAVENLPSNDFATFTVARGAIGEAFVLSSTAATGDFGVSPWQSLRYTAGAAGTYTIGFATVNDMLPFAPSRLYVDGMRSALAAGEAADLQLIGGRTDAFGGRFELFSPETEAAPGEARLITGFESNIDYRVRVGEVMVAGQYAEPDGCGSVYVPTEGARMAVLTGWGDSRLALETFLGLQKASGARTALPMDADGSLPVTGAATKLAVAVAAGDRISFDWMFDARDALPDNDFAVFTVTGGGGSQIFKLSDVRATGDCGASGWRTSVYTATADEDLTIGFAVVNDQTPSPPSVHENSRLLVDNVWLNRDFAGGYQLEDLAGPGDLATLPVA